jgi:hypothetical protein
MAQKETYILIATGGYLNDKVVVEKIHLTDDDEVFIEDEFEDFGEYVDYVLEDAAAEYEQGFSSVLFITEAQLPSLLGELSKIQSIKS